MSDAFYLLLLDLALIPGGPGDYGSSDALNFTFEAGLVMLYLCNKS